MVRTPTGGEDTERPNEQQTDGRRAPISDGDTKWRELLNGQYEVIKFCFSHPISFKTYWSQIILLLKSASPIKDYFYIKKTPAYSPIISFWT